MLTLVIAIIVFIGLAALVLRWATDDLAGPGTLSAKSLAVAWLLYVFHADTVTGAAWAGALAVDVPRVAALAIGAALAASGLGVFIAATLALVRHGDFAGLRTRRLVTVGPYSLSRHPQNVGWGILLLGIAIAGRSLVALALVALFTVFVERTPAWRSASLRATSAPHTTRTARAPRRPLAPQPPRGPRRNARPRALKPAANGRTADANDAVSRNLGQRHDAERHGHNGIRFAIAGLPHAAFFSVAASGRRRG